MTIARPPKSKAAAATPSVVDENQINALIDKGGSSTLAKPAEADQDDDQVKTILLRTYESQVREIDELLAKMKKRDRLSRNAYIVKAIDAQIKRDKDNTKQK